jgi:hypothetical protein
MLVILEALIGVFFVAVLIAIVVGSRNENGPERSRNHKNK